MYSIRLHTVSAKQVHVEVLKCLPMLHESRVSSPSRAKLAQRQSELAAQRREEVGRLAEKLGVLETDDDVIAGVFLELRSALGVTARVSSNCETWAAGFVLQSLNGRSDTPRMLRRVRTALIRIEACEARNSGVGFVRAGELLPSVFLGVARG